MKRLLPLLLIALLLAACESATEEDATAPSDTAVGSAAPTEAAAPTSTLPPPTATPEPTATPVPPTPTPEPTATPEHPTPTPVPEPKAYSGTGDNVVDIEKPGGQDQPVIAHIRGNAEGAHFAVKSFDDSGQLIDLLVNTTDPYEGVVPIDFGRDERTTRLQITAAGDWQIEVRPLSTARRVSIPGSIEGIGDDVVIIDGDPDIAHITGNSDARHFAVIAYGDSYGLLVNTTDPYDGRVVVDKDAVVLKVDAEGPWSISFE